MDEGIEEKEDGLLEKDQHDSADQKEGEMQRDDGGEYALLERQIWDPDKIDTKSVSDDFKNVNKSVVDEGCFFWLAIIIMFLIIAGVAIYLLHSIYDISSIDNVKSFTPCTLLFWVYVIQKIGFIVIFLTMGIPFARLFSTIIVAIIESKEKKTVRFVNMTKFLYILKYKGEVVNFAEYDKPLVKIPKKDPDSTIKDLSSLVGEIEKSGLVELLKKIFCLLKG